MTTIFAKHHGPQHDSCGRCAISADLGGDGQAQEKLLSRAGSVFLRLRPIPSITGRSEDSRGSPIAHWSRLDGSGGEVTRHVPGRGIRVVRGFDQVGQGEACRELAAELPGE